MKNIILKIVIALATIVAGIVAWAALTPNGAFS